RSVQVGPRGARLLRPGGRLQFLVHAFLLTLCVPAEDDSAAGDRLLRPAFENGPRTTALSFISLTMIGSDCCDSPDSRSRTWSSFVQKQTRRRLISSSRWTGHVSGPAKKYGKPADARRFRGTFTRDVDYPHVAALPCSIYTASIIRQPV